MKYIYFKIILIFFKFIYINNECIDIIPENKYDCFKLSGNTSYCCYISKLEGDKESKCFEYKDLTEYKGGNHIIYNSTKYKIDCGLGSTYMDSDWNMTIKSRYFCSTENPKNEKDCFKGSKNGNSCCYYEGHGLKRCYNLGIKFEGSTEQDGYTFICSSNFILLNKYFFIILLLFYI